MLLYEVLLIAYLIVAVLLVAFVLLQQGKGADMGASFGAGGSNTIFGSSGSGNFMTRTTAILATLFFTISLVIGGITAGSSQAVDEFETIQAITDEQTPAVETDGTEFPVSVENTEASAEELPEPPKEEDKP